MMTFKHIFITAAVVVFAGCAAGGRSDQVCFPDACFQVELAVTQAERAHGLMNRSSLPEDGGMLFVFGAERPYQFWMKNTLIPLDIIWLDYSRRVIHIERDVPPCTADPCPGYQPEGNALYVLEINGGKAVEAGIEPGDQAVFRLPSLNQS